MISEIHFLLLGHSKFQLANNFLMQNAFEMQKNGIFHCPLVPFVVPQQVTLKNIREFINVKDYAPNIKKRLSEFKFRPEINKLILNISHLIRQPVRILTWIEIVNLLFKNSKKIVHFYMAPPDIEVEYSYIFSLSRSGSFLAKKYIFDYLNNREVINKQLAILNKIKNIDINIVYFDHISDDTNFSEYFSSILDTYGILKNHIDYLHKYNRESIRFMECINLLFGSHKTFEALDWTNDRDFLYSSDQYMPFLSPVLRNKILMEYAASDKHWEQYVDAESYFAKAMKVRDQEYVDWFPPEKRDWNWAVRRAKCISSETAERILGARLLPSERQPVLSQLCLAALEAVHGTRKNARVFKFFEPKVTVLTASYNHKDYIGACIESVLSQDTNFPVEHIIADDGSTDGTQDVIMEYAHKHSTIKPILQQKNTGPSLNYALLFDSIRSPYVSLCDGDDYFTDNLKLQKQSNFLDDYKSCALCFHVVNILDDDSGEIQSQYPPVNELPRGIHNFYYLSDLIKFNFIQTNSVLYRWRFNNGIPDWFRTDLCPGDWYWHLLHAETGKIGFINDIMSVYRIHKNGVYYLSNKDRLKHRINVGFKELESYQEIDRHFKGVYHLILGDLASGVLADCLQYYNITGKTENDGEPTFVKLALRFPQFGHHFINSIKKFTAVKDREI